MNSYFKETDTIFTITKKYSETMPVFLSNGFPQMEDKNKLKTLGNTISLKEALLLKGKSYETYEELLVSAIEAENESEDISLLSNTEFDENSINIMGALPCPVRIPLLEAIAKFAKDYEAKNNMKIKHELKAASEGVAWVENRLKKVTESKDLPDVFISAGFETFFSKEGIGKFKDEGAFIDSLPYDKFNDSFSDIDLKDPMGHYSIISVVPAVFLVNMEELKGREKPETWADLLKPEFKNSVSIPVGDFDLFAGLLLNFYKIYGEDGVRKFGQSLLESMHPSQMVKSNKLKRNRPTVTVMPYFFTKMTKQGGKIQAVWPKDGAIISPIFMLSKKEKLDKSQEVVDCLASKAVGEILAHNGLFPSTNPEVDNRLEPDNKFSWLGWDFIYNNDIPALIKKCIDIFEKC